MEWVIESVGIFEDNFVYLIHNQKTCIIVDPGEALSTLEYLSIKKIFPAFILITHHHHDHVGGVNEILKKYPECKVIAPIREKERLETLKVNLWIEGNKEFEILNLKIKTVNLSGHTEGQIGYLIEELSALFSGDTLFALGCGRIFDGTYDDQFKTLSELKLISKKINIYCSHDYSSKNKSFCDSLNIFTGGYIVKYPLSLEQELQFNPFLKAKTLDEFTYLRDKRNNF